MTRLSLEVRLWVGALLVLQLLTSFAAIGLLARVSPAVDRILRENVPSMVATEEMLAVLARHPAAPVWGPDRARFEEALGRARHHMTEAEERALVERLEALSTSALGGDVDDRRQTVDVLVSLAEVNRASMRAADQVVRRIGAAGAWTAAIAGLLGAGLGAVVLNRLIHRIVIPVLKVDAALEAVRRGDRLRRCAPLAGPRDIVRLGENLNWMLDLGVRGDPAGVAATTEALRASLLARLDADPRPTVVVGAEGVVAVNAAAYHRAVLDPSPSAVAAAVIGGGPPPDGWAAEDVVPGRVWICVETHPRSGA